ncbi:MAG TPA: asparaginase [Anaerolineales bacterium]|nr:asparaginase [Anaerolineales bacterium]
MSERFLPLFEVTRGRIVESVHFGAIAVVDSNGRSLYSYGDPQTVAFLRSSAKPFQALPFVERGGVEHFGFTPRELALACASHETAQVHLDAVKALQEKIGIQESDLQCGGHLPGDPEMLKHVITHHITPTANFNNCSGKHTAMLAHAKMRGLPLETYLERGHPIQQDILTTFAEMCGMERDKVELGTDGCSAPNFAVPLLNAALGFARLCDPATLPKARAAACQKITSAMTSHSEMVSGSGEFDCELMKVGGGKILTKRGAEGFQAVGLLPGALRTDSRGLGIAFKVSDGDAGRMGEDLATHNRVRPAVTMAILQQLGALDDSQMKKLAGFGPTLPIKNHRGIVVGESRPVFTLVKA